MKLYTYYRSSAAYRVRIALNLKGISAQHIPVSLIKAEQKDATYRAVNPQGLVPALEVEGEVFTQSLAIMEYIEETHPQPPLLPADAKGRASVRAMALVVACDIHPLNNLRVLQALSAEYGATEAHKTAWLHRWMQEGFAALESMVARFGGAFAYGDAPTLADVCLVPQLYNAHRFACDLTPYPHLRAVEEACLALPAFQAATPENQPDAS